MAPGASEIPATPRRRGRADWKSIAVSVALALSGGGAGWTTRELRLNQELEVIKARLTALETERHDRELVQRTIDEVKRLLGPATAKQNHSEPPP